MGSLWIEADSVAIDALPEWAKSALPERGVALMREGIVRREGRRRASAATWGRIFGVVMHDPGSARDQRLLVLVPREPPMPPWLELRHDDVPSPIVGLPALEKALGERLAQGGAYRGREPDAVRLGAAELLERARAHAAIPGAVQVPIVSGRKGLLDGRWAQTAMAGAGGGALSAYFAAVAAGVTAGAAAPFVVMGVTLVGTVAAALAMDFAGARERRVREALPTRVLLLAPDGCICGFETGVAAFAWADVGEFRAEGPENNPLLVVSDRVGGSHGSIRAGWFAEPLSLIVAVAEAYRTRAAR